MKADTTGREFRTWVDLDDAGNVLATHEFEAGIEQPLPLIVDVTDKGPKDWSKAKPAEIADLQGKRQKLKDDIVKNPGGGKKNG